MSKQLIYLTNNTSNAVSAGADIPLGDITRKVGNIFTVSSSSVYINTAGYYLVDFAGTFTGTAGNVKIDIMSNGSTVTSATETITTATTEYHSVDIPAVVRVYCCAGTTIKAVVDSSSTATPTFTVTGLRVVKE